MVEAMLDAILGRWWRTAIATFQEHFMIFLVPLLAWMAVMVIGNQVVRHCEQAMRAKLRSTPSLRRAGGPGLARALDPVVLETAATHRWMPAFHGLWMKHAQPEEVLTHMTRLPNYYLRFRDEVYGTTGRRTRKVGATR